MIPPVLSITKILPRVLGEEKNDKMGLMCPEQKKPTPLRDWTIGPRGHSAMDLTSDLLSQSGWPRTEGRHFGVK